jgi:hypothetical protein
MRIAIVGGSPSTEHDHPQDGEVWIHGNQLDRHKDCHFTRVFEIHNDLSNQSDKYPQWLVDQCKERGVRLIVGDTFPLLQAAGVEVYPSSEAYAILPLLTSTPAYMMGMAVIEGAERIEIYGVDMSVDDFEYFYQRPAMYAWIGYAKAQGIDVYIPNQSSLFFDKHIEGKTDRSLGVFASTEFEALANIHAQKIDEAKDQIAQWQAKIQGHDGCRQAYERMAKVSRALEAGINVKTLTETVRVAP